MKKRILGYLLPGLVFFCGLAVLLYPVFSDLWNQHRQNRLIEDYVSNLAERSQQQDEALLAAAQAYNEALDPSFHDAFDEEIPAQDSPYWQLLNPDGNGMMGYLEIPKISVRLPIYHGTDESVLQKGIGHLAGTSLPVGGAGTHCVLSAHRGLPSALLFTDLDSLACGDQFFLYVLQQTLCYEVDQILVVTPQEVSALLPDQTGDYVTLLTCTPYGVNTHRLLVRGHRVPTPAEPVSQVTALQQIRRSFGWRGKLLLAMLALGLFAGVLFGMRRIRHGRETRNTKREDRQNETIATNAPDLENCTGTVGADAAARHADGDSGPGDGAD